MQALHYLGKRQLEWREIDDAQLVETTDAIVKPLAVAACDLDRNIVMGTAPFAGPFVLGHEFVAEVLQVGEGVAEIGVGDVVLASFQPSCGSCPRCHQGHSSVCATVPNTSMYGIGASGGDWSGAFAEALRVPFADFSLRSIPKGIEPRILASASDNLADGLRAVDQPLQSRPGASVLVAGSGSIALYALLCAKYLGSERVVMASKDKLALNVAADLGVECLEIDDWPKRLGSFDITMDCTNDPRGLSTVVKSTASQGWCTSGSIYYAPTTPMPLVDMYMKGIQFHTGRVNSASQLDRVLALVADGLNPDLIQPLYQPASNAIEALIDAPVSRKLIIEMGFG